MDALDSARLEPAPGNGVQIEQPMPRAGGNESALFLGEKGSANLVAHFVNARPDRRPEPGDQCPGPHGSHRGLDHAGGQAAPSCVCDADDAPARIGEDHTGWRGLSSGVIEATVRAMGPGTLIAWLGPAIGPRVYEVGDEVRAAFLPEEQGAFVATRPVHWLLDLYAVARRRLESSGVKRVYGGGFCAYSEPQRFFSYRRERATGRMAALVWLT